MKKKKITPREIIRKKGGNPGYACVTFCHFLSGPVTSLPVMRNGPFPLKWGFVRNHILLLIV